MNRGKLVIIVILTVGVTLASFAWWNRWSRSQQVLAHWGPTAPLNIRKGDTVELLWLEPLGPADSRASVEVLRVGTDALKITRVLDISQTPGLIHPRHQLVQDEAFDWDQPRAADCDPAWTRALRFRRDEEMTTVVFDFHCQRAMLLERDREVGMQPIAAGMKTFLASITATELSSADGATTTQQAPSTPADSR